MKSPSQAVALDTPRPAACRGERRKRRDLPSPPGGGSSGPRGMADGNPSEQGQQGQQGQQLRQHRHHHHHPHQPRAYIPVSARKTPVTIITGYLGVGKTTLLNHILHNKGEKYFAVIENEFGDIEVDSSLVAANLRAKEDLVSLENGCVCCSLRKDIVRALAELDARGKSRGRPFDAVLLETTGLADPAPVAFTFFANPWIAARFKLDSILCVVDVEYTLRNLTMFEDQASPSDAETVNECVRQLAFADLILLNKLDLVSPEDLNAVRSITKRINTSASMIECQLNREDRCPALGSILGVDTFSLERALELDPTFLDSDSGSEDNAEDSEDMEPCVSDDPDEMMNDCTAPEDNDNNDTSQPNVWNLVHSSKKEGFEMPGISKHVHRDPEESGDGIICTKGKSRFRHYHHHDRRRHHHAAKKGLEHEHREDRRPKRQRKLMHDTMGICSVAITAHGALHQWRFNMFLRDFFTEKSNDIFRCKGVLCIKGYEDTKFVFQGVHDNIVYGPSPGGWASGEERMNRIVFIGKNLSRKALTSALRTCIWTPLPPGWREQIDHEGKELFYVHEETGHTQRETPTSMERPHVVVSDVVPTVQPEKLQPTKKPTKGSMQLS